MQPSLFDTPGDPDGGANPHVVTCRPAESLGALSEAISRAKGGDRLAPVTVIVSTNISGVMARRALGRSGGVLGVDVITLGRVAELVAGPSLAEEGRQPVSSPVLDVAIAKVLANDAGLFAPVADHPTTVTALREAHTELRLGGVDAVRAIARRGRRGAEVARVSGTVEASLRSRWYDEADVLGRATELLASGPPPGVGHLVLYLPQRLDAMSSAFLRSLVAAVPTTVVAALTGDPEADGGVLSAIATAGGSIAPPNRPGGPARCVPDALVSTTDADDEVRVAVRAAVDAARGNLTGEPVPFERIGIFWPTHTPYARLVEHHLTADEVPWNGRGGTAITERIAPRLLLDLLDVDRRRFRRSDLFELLADVPARDPEGRRRPIADWQRVARAVGVSEGSDWNRLRTVDPESRWSPPATQLVDFVDDLRSQLGRPDLRRTWKEWTDWSNEQLTRWLGPRAEIKMSDAEYRAWEALMTTLDRLRSLDHVAEPATRHRFRSVLENELDVASVREGRIGTGLVAGSLVSAPGLDLDVAIVVGAVDGLMPPAPRSDALLNDADRAAAGLPSSDEHAHRVHHALRSVVDGCYTVVTAPRGDLRATTEHRLSRWIESPGDDRFRAIDSSTAGLRELADPPCEREHRLSGRLRSGVPSDPAEATALGDLVVERAVSMRAGRASDRFTEFDGDLTGVEVPSLGDRPVSPTQIQTWSKCPHAYFNQYVLGVRPIEELDREISIRPLDSGTLQHDVLDLLHRDVIEGRLPQPASGWGPEHRAALLEHFDAVCADVERRGRSGRPATWFGARAALRADVLEWLERDGAVMAAHGGQILGSEVRFGSIPRDDQGVELFSTWEPVVVPLADGRRLPMLGSADRIDRWSDGTVTVTDHKTGNDNYKQLSADDPTLGATVFQLPAYAAAAQAMAPDATTFRAEYSMFGKGKYARRQVTFTDEVWEQVAADLGHVVDGIEAGWFPQFPEPPGFRLWIACEHCDPDGIGTDDAWARWSAKRNDPRSARWFAEPADDVHDGAEGASS